MDSRIKDLDASERHIAIALCTRRRKKMLQRCLESLIAVEPPENTKLSITVVENDDAPAAEDVIKQIAKTTSIPIYYKVESRAGISFARNCAVEHALTINPDFIAFVDDDETVRRDWLIRLVDVLAEFQADVVTGPVHKIFEEPPPRWRSSQPADRRKNRRVKGELLRRAGTNNVLFSVHLVSRQGFGLRFETRLKSGADTDFFSEAYAQGAKIVWATDACVDELVVAQRTQISRVFHRMFVHASTKCRRSSLREGTARTLAYFVPKAFFSLVLGIIYIPAGTMMLPLKRKGGGSLLFDGLRQLVRCAGFLHGFFFSRQTYYDQIDGC